MNFIEREKQYVPLPSNSDTFQRVMARLKLRPSTSFILKTELKILIQKEDISVQIMAERFGIFFLCGESHTYLSNYDPSRNISPEKTFSKNEKITSQNDLHSFDHKSVNVVLV